MRNTITFRQALNGTAGTFVPIPPTIFAGSGLVSLVTAIVPPESIAGALPTELAYAPMVGAMLGSIAAGHPLTGYVLVGELQAIGLGLAMIVAFLVSWVTVGVVQLPAEMASLGARFALCGNAICFLSAIVIGYSWFSR